jgi:3-hydroxyisobutyrate dehydrogenase-like beta-hydroxyacid dehydrogenase
MATRIIDAGWPTVLWARRPSVLEAFGAPSAGSPAELAAAVSLIGICVWADDDVRSVFDAVIDGCRPGTIIVIHSTVQPATCQALAGAAGARGVLVVDAPVSGGPHVALDGGLAVAAGGPAEAVARCRPVFESFARTVVHLGDVGAGQVAKLLNNALFVANMAVADDVFGLAEGLGVDVKEMATFIAAASGRSYGLDIALQCRTSPAMRQGVLPALAKDVENLPPGAPLLEQVATEMIGRLRQHLP